MRRAQAPYAIAAALVLVVSIAVLAGALAMGGLLDERLASDASPAPSASRPAIELSGSGRLAYWRTEPNGDNQLWVSNIDGSGKHPIAKIDLLSRVSSTRWSPDGSAVAYLDRGQSVIVQRLDGAGSRYELALPQFLVASNSRIIDFSWSTDGTSVAATVRGASSGNPNGDTDVYVAATTGPSLGQWRSVTNVRNAFLSQWISPVELLIHTQNGLIALATPDGLLPLTGLVATSPFVGDDGRIYFLAGQVAPTIRDQTVPVINAAQARVWSMTLDGGDLKQETTQSYDDVRLVGRWPGGQFIVHLGASTALAFLQSGLPAVAAVPGVVDRLVFSPDRRTGIGLSATRISRYDTAQPDKPVVLLSDVTQPDAWYPNTVSIARPSPRPTVAAAPAARYAFALGGLIFNTSFGYVRETRELGTDDRGLRRLSGVAVPQWSPKGDRILYFDVPANSFAGVVFVTDAAGNGARISDLDASGPFPSWTPDGNVAYTRFAGSRDSAGFVSVGEVRVVSPTGGGPITTYQAREIAFGGGKTFLIDNGKPVPPAQGALPTRSDHAILEVTATGTRTVATAASLAAFERFGGATAIPWQLSMLGASADGTFLSVRESPAVGSIGFTFTLLRVSDGTGTQGLSGADVADVRWAPTGHLVGMTLLNVPIVRDPETGAIVASAGSGRFAGWSPDGKWFYVARDIGLYAMPVSGGDPVRISALGVPVSATTP